MPQQTSNSNSSFNPYCAGTSIVTAQGATDSHRWYPIKFHRLFRGNLDYNRSNCLRHYKPFPAADTF
jgi:hypothetical protein